MTKKSSQPSRLPPWGVGLQTASGVAAITACGDYFSFSPLLGAGATIVGGLCSVVANAGAWGPPAAVATRLGRWAALGTWFTWAWSDYGWAWSGTATGDAHEWSSLAVLGAGAMIGAHARPWLHRLHQQHEPASVALLPTGRERRWADRIQRVGGIQLAGVTVPEVTDWPNGHGYDVTVVLPAGGATADNLRTHLAGLGADANLPHGCTIELLEPAGEGQRTVTLRVPITNQMNETVDYPTRYESRSVHDGVPFGQRPNAETASAPIREESWLVVGKRGSGKTTLLHGITATVGLCRDALVWHIDLNGGGLSQPWVEAWLDGRVERCPIDWAAPTVDEGLRMLRAAVRIAKHRKTAYRRLKKQHNTNLLPVSEDLPEIVILLDEGAEALEAASTGQVRELKEALEEIQRIARNEAVNLVLSCLRGTSDLIPQSMTTQIGVGVVMKVEKTKEIAAVFESAWELKLKPNHLTRKGAGWLGVDGGDPTRFQSWNILPNQMDEVGLCVAELRPDLDLASAEVAGQDYTTRYERMAALFADEATQELLDEVTATTASSLPNPLAGTTAATWGSPLDIAGATAPGHVPAPAPPRTTSPSRVPLELAWATRLAEESGQPRVSTTWLIKELDLEHTHRKFAMLLESWGAPVGKQRIHGVDVRGPATSDLKAAVARIESGGPVDITPADDV